MEEDLLRKTIPIFRNGEWIGDIFIIPPKYPNMTEEEFDNLLEKIFNNNH